MIDVKDTEVRLAEHQMRVARINREAWKWQGSDPTGTPRIRSIAVRFAAIRQHAGMAIIHAGFRLLPSNSESGARS